MNKIIDYNHIQNHFDAKVDDVLSGTYYLVEKTNVTRNDSNTIVTLNFDIDKDDDADEVSIKRGEHYCEWIRKSENMNFLKNWFRKKYGQ